MPSPTAVPACRAARSVTAAGARGRAPAPASGCIQAAPDHLAAKGYPIDPADVARLTPLGHPTINLDGRYRTTNRPPATGLTQDPARILVTGQQRCKADAA
jgi:hypothetical protein